MNPQQMTQQVNAELANIPKWPGEHQSYLRAVYNARRRASLGQNAPAGQTPASVLGDSVASVRAQFPGAALHFDEAYFGVTAAQLAGG